MNPSAKINVLIRETAIAAKVAELGRRITKDYAELLDGAALCVVCVLKGSVVFFADLIRQIDLPITCEFVRASSYGDSTTSSGVVSIESIGGSLRESYEGRHVLIVEDIVDTGITLKHLIEHFEGLEHQRRPRSIRTCALLHKPGKPGKTVVAHAAPSVEYVGFTIGDSFVVGYGLDHKQELRNLPYVGVLVE
jgi:hypoxanthine phosphoribosyltransferase